MSDYDSMSFKELVQETINHSCNDLLLPPDDWLDMMRRAVIREASAGTCRIGIDFDMRLNDDGTKIADGEYHLVPKETP